VKISIEPREGTFPGVIGGQGVVRTADIVEEAVTGTCVDLEVVRLAQIGQAAVERADVVTEYAGIAFAPRAQQWRLDFVGVGQRDRCDRPEITGRAITNFAVPHRGGLIEFRMVDGLTKREAAPHAETGDADSSRAAALDAAQIIRSGGEI